MAKFKVSEIRLCGFKFYDFLLNFNNHNLYCYQYKQKSDQGHNQNGEEIDSNGDFQLVQFSHSVVSDSLRPHGLQHARPPCPSPAPGACSNSISIKSVMPSNHLILCRPLFLLPSIFPTNKKN